MRIQPHHINTTGYLKGKKSNRNKVNIIPSHHITTKGMTRPILANGHVLHPNTGDYIFHHAPVVEQPIPKARLGHTVTTPQYLSTYPNDKNTTPPMTKSFRGRKSMRNGGRTFDPQLGNYMSNIYQAGGLAYPGYPYAGYNDSERGMFSGMMQMGGPMPMPPPGGAMPQPGMMPPQMMPPMQGPQQAPPQHRGRGGHPRGRGKGKMQIGGSTSVPSYRTTKITSRFQPDQTGGEMDDDWKDVFYDNPDMKKGGHWIQGAVNPAHKGYCTPMSKPTCTGRRRALALLFKRKHGFHKHQDGGYLQGMEMQRGGYQPDPNPQTGWRPEYMASPSEYGHNYTPAGPTYNMFPSRGFQGTPTAADSADYRNAYMQMRTDPRGASHSYDSLWGAYPHETPLGWNHINAYEDAMQPGTAHLYMPPDTKKPKQKKGGTMRGRMQSGGPASFTPAGSLVDQNTWAIGSEGTPIVPPTSNYHKTDPSQTSLTSALPGQPATVPLTNMHRSYQLQQNVNNHPALQAMLPINAGLSSLAQHNDWRQRQSSYIQAQTNPLSTMAYDNGRTPESRYGYSTYQGGGETMRFAGVPLHLWQRGGDTGASRTLRPYMLHQGRFQAGGQSGDLMDQWDMEDAQDGVGSGGGAPANMYDEDQGYNSEISRRANLSNDEDYEAALQVAMSKSALNNSYLW